MPEAVFDRSYYVLPNDTPVCSLDARKAFDSLSDKEKLYAHHIARASWDGSLIVFIQTSPESPLIFVVLHKLFACESLDELRKRAIDTCEFTEEEFKALLVYAAAFFYNNGNYKGFGDTKFVPDVDSGKLERLVLESSAAKKENNEIARLWEMIKTDIYSLNERERILGYGAKGVTTYHSRNITDNDAEMIDLRYMKERKLEGWNSRLFKSQEGGKTLFDIRLASAESGEVKPAEEFESVMVKTTKGDYSPLMKLVAQSLEKAKIHAANEQQKCMLEKYVQSFTTGDVDAHKDGSRYWIKDISPAIESYIGFIENYRDPAGVRSEFEGFVAAVNREMSKKFSRLVSNAEHLLKRLPWGEHYEKDTFLKPDFTSLDVLAFGSSGIPAGINIPNYDEIRQSEGFKNVSLGNVISAIPDTRVTFISDEDDAMFKKYFKESFTVQVGLHELLGHGSGKLFIKNADGTFNFDKEQVKDLKTGEKVDSWYDAGETWGSKFGALASAYEECRAEAVGYFLCCFEDVLKIFDYEGAEAADIKYTNWMSELRAGLVAIEYYFPNTQSWGQAHCYARHVLLRVCMAAGNGFVTLKECTAEDGKPDLFFAIDRSKIDTVGKEAIYEFLKVLQLFKSTGNFQKGKALFEGYAQMDEQWVMWRQIVVDRRKPRRLFVQPNTFEKDGQVTLVEYAATTEGVIQSVVERFQDAHIDQHLVDLSAKDKQHFK